jgi:hypothetical protein
MDDQAKGRGRPSDGPKQPVYARISSDKHELLHRLKDEKGWSLVTAMERAVDALAKQEGFSEHSS